MAITTTFSGNVRRFNNDSLELDKRISGTKTVTEYSGAKLAVATGSIDISIRPAGLRTIRTVYVETDYKISVELLGGINASFKIYDI